LEYAANGHYYWTREVIRDYAEQTARNAGRDLEDAMRELMPDLDSVDAFFERFQVNLREGQVRLVFFMEDSPMELRSVVDFLNRQMERSEVLLVEARQYHLGDTRVVVPILFGYTEQARQIKRSQVPQAQRKRWDRASFLEDARSRLSEMEYGAVQSVLTACEDLGCEIRWGTGKTAASFIVGNSQVCAKTIFAVYSDGTLWLPFGALRGDPQSESVSAHLAEMAGTLGLKLPEDYRLRWVMYRSKEWTAKAQSLIAAFRDLIVEASSGSGSTDSNPHV
jgi:hypothetical protein